ncbi:uncharacterized transporter slc-17.2-like isoform X2 [Ruditapes philippinarum]|nr:uncharacterized transporter slc-17.2-like isoform X2 [Ruditapes philippinarum]
MERNEKETDYLENKCDMDQFSKLSETDQPTVFCSMRWRMLAYISLSLTIMYMHRVNMSLAVVCMVNTSHSDTLTSQSSNSDIYIIANSSIKGVLNGVQADETNISSVENMIYNDQNATIVIERDTDDIQCGNIVLQQDEELALEIHWSKSDVSILLSSYLYGSFFTQILGGTLSDIFGGKHIITTAMLVSAICSLLTPVGARTSLVLMFIIRICAGFAGGAVVPAGMSMINSWSTPHERSVMIAISHSGAFTGAIITYLTSGFLCAYGFDNGWASIFYIHGCITALFLCLWLFEGYSLPSHHPRISKKELEYIEKSRSHKINTQRPKTPWKQLLLSKAHFGTLIAHFAIAWSILMVLINIPLFLNEVLKFQVKSNGLYSAMPFIFLTISSVVCGKLSGVLIERKIIGHLATRRLFSTVSILGMATCLVCTGYVSCEVRYIAVVLLCLGCTLNGFAYGGVLSNHPEYAGQFAGTAFGITNAGGVIAGIIASMTAGFLTPNGSQEEWQNVFFLAAGVNVIGAIAFLTCSDVYLQPWARGNQDEITIEVDESKELQNIKKLDGNVVERKSDEFGDSEEIKALTSDM